ncbi:MAG: 6-carboxytetrahydropterin synthase [Dehalococcoidia bacterium]|nr:6-carboxytetrahydropterin synthase [Dehalococcoidia bacterium]
MSTYRVTKQINFCYGHRLLNHNGKCRYLHGHNGLLEVDVESTGLDNMGMVVDFGLVKDVVKGWVDTNLDHKMLLSRNDPVIPYLKQLGEPFYLMDGNPTAENIARLIFLHAHELGLNVSEVRLWETPSNCAIYREGA